MPETRVDEAVFARVPTFRRGIVVARGMNNRKLDGLAAEDEAAIPAVRDRVARRKAGALLRRRGGNGPAHPRRAARYVSTLNEGI